MTAVQPFVFEGAPVRVTVGSDGEPRFAAADVCAVLGYAGGARNAVARLPERMKGVAHLNTPGGEQQMTVLTESGVNRLVMRAETALAERVQDWLAEDVLPAIRKTGTYSVPAQRALPQTFAEALRALADESEQREAAEAKVAELEPQATFAREVLGTEGHWSVREAAQILDCDPGIETGQGRLFATLRELGWLDKHSRAMQRHINNGRLAVRARSFENRDTGERRAAAPQVRIRPKGLQALHQHLRGEVPVEELIAAATRQEATA